MQETKTQREERKHMYISHVLARARGTGDHNALIEEASQKWEGSNQHQID